MDRCEYRRFPVGGGFDVFEVCKTSTLVNKCKGNCHDSNTLTTKNSRDSNTAYTTKCDFWCKVVQLLERFTVPHMWRR